MISNDRAGLTSGSGTRLHVSPDGGDGVYRTIGEAVSSAEPGTHIVIAAGIYREAVSLQRSGTAEAPIVLEAEEAGTVIITGTDLVSGWEPHPKRRDVWCCDLATDLKPEEKYGELAGRREQVFVNGVRLRQVLHESELTPGTFLYSESAHRYCIHPGTYTEEDRETRTEFDMGEIAGHKTVAVDRSDPDEWWQVIRHGFDPVRARVEVTTRAAALQAGNWEEREPVSHIHMRGLIFRGAAAAPQRELVYLYGSHFVCEDCIFEQSAGRGLTLRADNSRLSRCIIRDNGQLGLTGFGRNNVVEDSDLLYNNYKHSTFACFENGGCKIVLSHNWVFRRTRAIGNDGPGIWFDIRNHDALIEQCWCEGNSGPGIMYEISYTATIRNNICVRNGILYQRDVTWDSHHASVGEHEPVYSQGILVQFSEGCSVYNNTCVGNRRVGIELRHHPYQQCEPGDPDFCLKNNRVLNNILCDNGWDNIMVTDVPAHRKKTHEVSGNQSDYNLVHMSKSLLQHRGNLVEYARNGKNFRCGSASLEEWRAATGHDYHSIQWDPFFIDPQRLDFRLQPHSPAIGRGQEIPELTTDYLGRARPAGASPTMGAIEFDRADSLPICGTQSPSPSPG